MENDQSIQNQDQENIGGALSQMTKNPERAVLFKKAYQLWRQHGISVPDAMKIVELSDYYYAVTVDIFDLYLQLECDVEFPQRRESKRLPPKEHFNNLNIQAAQGCSNKFDDHLTPTFSLFSAIKNILSGLDYRKYESEEDSRVFSYKIGDIVSKRYTTTSLQIRYGDVKWKIKSINESDIILESMVSTARDFVNSDEIVFISRD